MSRKRINTTPTFPVGNTFFLVFLVLLQVLLLFFGFTNQPRPQDLIRDYRVTVEPRENGSLDISYHFVWEALDASEELTWVEIGMANENFSVYPNSFSHTIASWSTYTDDGYCALQLDFTEPYLGGEVVEFSFKINQKDMLCQDEEGYFYEFVPGWFNSIQVQHYEFTWVLEGDDLVRSGSLDYGGYDTLFVRYGPEVFTGCRTVDYWPFSHSECYNGLESDRVATIVMFCILAGLLLIPEVYIIDSYVSYSRGRGFLTGYGHHVHMYGRSNPRYISARDRHLASSSSSRGGRSGGCACACACACAGGGRAGCSQKDTYAPK